MSNGALYMPDNCHLCKVEMTQSYFLRIDKDLVEVCPECHHYFTYGTEEQKQKYKERRNIK